MRKEIHPGIIAVIVAAVVIVVVILAWKALAPPGPVGIKSFTKESLQSDMQKHAASAKAMAEQQSKLYQQAHGGGQ